MLTVSQSSNSGWGYKSSVKEDVEYLRHVTVPLMTNRECRSQDSAGRTYLNIVWINFCLFKKNLHYF